MNLLFGQVIVIEGPDAVGKSTQVDLLTHALRRYGDRSVKVKIPFNDGITRSSIYKALRTGWAKRHPTLFQALVFMNKFVFQALVLPWLRLTNDYVVLDRWSLSGAAYGLASGVSPRLCGVMSGLLASPDITIVVNGRGFKRAVPRDEYEKDDEFQREVKEHYHSFCSLEKNTFEIDSDRTVDEVHESILELLKFEGVI
jgi:dTMP kinase